MLNITDEELDKWIRSYPRVDSSGYGYTGKYTYQSQVGLGAVSFHKTLAAARKQVARILRQQDKANAE